MKKTTKKLRGFWICKGTGLPYENEKKPARKLKLGGVYDVYGRIEVCKNGLHASDTLSHAGMFVAADRGTTACYVEVWGDLDLSRNNKNDVTPKFCGRHRKILSMHKICRNFMDLVAVEKKLIEKAKKIPRSVKVKMTPQIVLYRAGSGHIKLDDKERARFTKMLRRSKKK